MYIRYQIYLLHTCVRRQSTKYLLNIYHVKYMFPVVSIPIVLSIDVRVESSRRRAVRRNDYPRRGSCAQAGAGR